MSVKLACRETGNGPPLLILHGLFGSAGNWSGIARRLAARYRVITPELRNHGASPHAASMDYAEQAEDLLDLMDRLALEAATFIGHSMGGKAAMVFALRHPERISRLVVVDIAPDAYRHRHTEIIQAMRALDLQHIQHRQDAHSALAQAIPDERIRQFLLQNLVRSEDHYRWRINLDALLAGEAQIAGFPRQLCPLRTDIPCLFLGGTLSPYLREPHRSAIADCFPAARTVMLEHAGHWLHAERTDAFVAELTDFLNVTDSTDAGP